MIEISIMVGLITKIIVDTKAMAVVTGSQHPSTKNAQSVRAFMKRSKENLGNLLARSYLHRYADNVLIVARQGCRTKCS